MAWWDKFKKMPTGRNPQLMEGQDAYVFRRSRTLTGSVSNQVNAAVTERAHLKTDRLKLHELRAHQRQVFKLLAAVGVLVALLGWLLMTFIATPAIATPQPGVRQADATAYRTTILTYFNDHPLERFGFLLNVAELERYLQVKHVEIGSVIMNTAWYGGNARFNVFFRESLMVWRAGAQQFYVDGQGMAFAYNHFAEPPVSVVDQSGLPPDSGGVIASARFVRFLGRMVGAVNGYGNKVSDVIIPASTRQIDLKLEGRPYIIKTHIDRDPLEQAEDIAATLRYLDSKGVTPEYIDVRVAHKAFYK